VDVSSGEEPPCQKGSSSEVPKDVDAPIRALITLRDPGAAVLGGPSASVDVPVASLGPRELVVAASLIGPCLEGSSTASATADPIAREVPPVELTTVSSAVAPVEPSAASPAVVSSSEDVAHLASSVGVRSSERVRPQEPIVPSSAIVTSSGRVCLCNYFVLTLVFPRSTLLTLFLFRT
jgi:hypothetical protein